MLATVFFSIEASCRLLPGSTCCAAAGRGKNGQQRRKGNDHQQHAADGGHIIEAPPPTPNPASTDCVTTRGKAPCAMCSHAPSAASACTSRTAVPWPTPKWDATAAVLLAARAMTWTPDADVGLADAASAGEVLARYGSQGELRAWLHHTTK